MIETTSRRLPEPRATVPALVQALPAARSTGVPWRKGKFGADSAVGSRLAERLLTLVASWLLAALVGLAGSLRG